MKSHIQKFLSVKLSCNLLTKAGITHCLGINAA